MNVVWKISALVGAFAFVIYTGRARQTAPEPPTNSVFTSQRAVTCLARSDDGTVWAGTTGGVLRRDPQTQTWTGYTRAHGLPAHEVQSIVENAMGVTVVFAGGKAARWQQNTWQAITPTTSRVATNTPVTLTPTGNLRVGNRPVPFPPSPTGTHIVAALPGANGDVLTAVWGDNAFYRWRAGTKTWTREETGLPEEVGRQITVVEQSNGLFWVGTRRSGVWEGDTRTWKAVDTSLAGPYNHNAQAIATFRGDLFVSTLEDGLMVRTVNGWHCFRNGSLSSDAPRQLLVFGDALYVRHGNGMVDRFDGTVWAKNVWAGLLPRKQVSALAAQGDTLYAAQWGGWSAWHKNDRELGTWSHHFNEALLQGIPVTALCSSSDGKTLWVGTQGRGLLEVDEQTGVVRRRHDERDGLTDDWITTLAQSEGHLWVGTFVGGLLRASVIGWAVVPGTENENITDLAPMKKGTGVLIATRHGVRLIGTGIVPPLVAGREIEAQCLQTTESGGLWVGTRTGIYFVKP